MKQLSLFVVFGLVAFATNVANAVVLIGGPPAMDGTNLNNGNLDLTYAQEIVPAFFLPKPQVWQNIGTRTIGGPYEDEMSSEPWAGPAPTPVTTGGTNNPPHPEGCGGPDCAVFFKPFSGSDANGLATGHLLQDVPGVAGTKYRLTGWAGVEPNALLGDAQFAVEFLDAGSSLIGGTVLSLLPTLFADNGQPFDYKKYTVADTAPPGTAFVRARASMIDAVGNPAGGGQAFVIDDFTLESVPEPATLALVALAIVGLVGIRRRSS
jgi:hypothetical protein